MGTDRVRIALIGAGRMGQVHLEALQRSEAIEVAGVVEPFEATRERLGGIGCPLYSSVDELLARPPVDGALDGVLIAAPSDQHPGLVATFAAAGIPMLCEKPVGIRADEARAAAAAADEAGVLLQVGYWRRFVPSLREQRERLICGELGELTQLACMQWDGELPAEGFRAHSGGICIDMGVHELDQARWLTGQEFDWLAALPAGRDTAPRDPADPDSATIFGRLGDGTAVMLSLGRRFALDDSCWVELWATGGYERIPFMWGSDGAEVFLSAMTLQAEAFARAVRGGPPEGAGGADAIIALELAESAARSLAAGSAKVEVTALI